MTTAYYQFINQEDHPDGSRTSHYKPTIHAQGAWNAHEQHMAPASGILAHELERFHPHNHMRIGRISYDIFGLIHLEPFSITTRIIRPGKTIELVESSMQSQGKTCIIARAWRMMTQDTRHIHGIEDEVIYTPSELPNWDGMKRWPGGYIQSIQLRVSPEHRPGKGIVWISTNTDLVEGQACSEVARLMGLVDTANGIVPRQQDPFVWAFPNLDLQVHMYRLPQGTWLGLETVQQYGSDGIGLTSSILHDIHGPFGRSEQILTLRPLSQP